MNAATGGVLNVSTTLSSTTLVGVRRGGLVIVVNATMQPVAVDLEHPELSIARPVFSSEPNEMHTPGVIPANSTVWFAS
jgi:alpha-glucosidase